MDLKFQQSEGIAARRRWIIVLVQDADATAGLTGAIGQVYISKNGGTPALSTNSLVEVDAVNMPGHYYIELTQAELDTLGWISIVKKTASSKAFHDRGFVSYDDPAARHGGFAFEGRGGAGKGGGISKLQAKALLDDFRKIIQEELAKEEKIEAQEQMDYTEKLDTILAAVTAEVIQEEIDFSPILNAINNLPNPKDYSKDLKKIAVQINAFGNAHQIDVGGFTKSVTEFQGKIANATSEVAGSTRQVQVLRDSFIELQNLMTQFQTTLKEQSDMDKRFDAMNSASNNKKIDELTMQIKDLQSKLQLQLTNFKFQVLQQLIKK